ncbi:MAG: hypothetical protein KAV00_17640, partial [Phycisphaerae bacterium]|nr:hypothetical protein [Phycisphaerae bacterium]
MSEWEEIFSRIHDGLKKYNLIYRPYEYICDYVRSHHDTRISDVSVNDETGRVHCKLQGKSRVTTALEVYANKGDGVQCQSCDVPQFTGAVSVES